jgi:hypothetical protein
VSQESQQFCATCGEETPHQGARCCRCTPDPYAIDPAQAERIKRKLSEIPQKEGDEKFIAKHAPKPGEDTADYILRLSDMNRRPKGRPAKRRGMNRKNLVRKLGKLRKGSDPPINVEDPAFVEHMRRIQERRDEDFKKGGMRFMESLFATAERIRSDPRYLERFPRIPDANAPDEVKQAFIVKWGELGKFFRHRRARMVKPWKGHKGREAVKKAGTTTKRKLSKKEFAITLRDEQPDFTHSQIAEKITKRFKLKNPCSERTVRRYLNE